MRSRPRRGTRSKGLEEAEAGVGDRCAEQAAPGDELAAHLEKRKPGGPGSDRSGLGIPNRHVEAERVRLSDGNQGEGARSIIDRTEPEDLPDALRIDRGEEVG